jgi:hypothetical protein
MDNGICMIILSCTVSIYVPYLQFRMANILCDKAVVTRSKKGSTRLASTSVPLLARGYRRDKISLCAVK